MTNLNKVHHYFRDFESPSHFITWGYYYMIASCLGRKVWFQESNPVFANISGIIVGPPGIGKTQPCKILADILRNLKTIIPNTNPPVFKDMVYVTPQRVTIEKLYNILANAIDAFDYKGKKHIHTSACFFLENELGIFLKRENIQDFVMFLNSAYDCPPTLEYDTKKNGTDIIKNLCLNFLACTTPDWISRNLPASVIGDGWSSRVFFIYGERKRQLSTYITHGESQLAALTSVKQHFFEVAKLVGEVKFTPEADAYFHKWYQEKSETERHNRDPKLEHYYTRKKLHIWKLAMIIHFSERLDMLITLPELLEAFRFLAETEIDMHKALASVNVNPTARLAEDIQRCIKTAEGQTLSRIAIIAKNYNNAIGGMAAIDEALNYLIVTGRIARKNDGFCTVENIVKFPVSLDSNPYASQTTETTNEPTKMSL